MTADHEPGQEQSWTARGQVADRTSLQLALDGRPRLGINEGLIEPGALHPVVPAVLTALFAIVQLQNCLVILPAMKLAEVAAVPGVIADIGGVGQQDLNMIALEVSPKGIAKAEFVQ